MTYLNFLILKKKCFFIIIYINKVIKIQNKWKVLKRSKKIYFDNIISMWNQHLYFVYFDERKKKYNENIDVTKEVKKVQSFNKK